MAIFATLGAGSTLPLPPFGKLKSDFDREHDVNDPKILSLAIDPSFSEKEQNDLIQKIIDTDKKYPDDLDYDLLPDVSKYYNSNSYLSGLLDAVDIKKPSLFDSNAFPEWEKPVPKNRF